MNFEFFLIIISFSITLLLGVPIAFVLGITSLIWVLYIGVPTDIILQRMFTGIDSFPFIAIPLFILTGLIMERSGILEELIDFCNSIVGHFRGALSYVNVLASMIFAGISGSAAADAAGLGQIEIKMMKKAGYDLDFSAAITAASAVLGPIIPPSIIMVIYGITMEVSITKLFVAGVFPGILLAILLVIACYFISKKRNYPKGKRHSFKEILKATKKAFWILLLPLIIFFGITTGVFTPTESAAVAVFYSLIVTAIIVKKLKIRQFVKLLIDCGLMTSIVLFMVSTANIFAWLIALSGIPQNLINLLTSITNNPKILISLIVIVLLLAGMFMEIIGALILFSPILVPLGEGLGFHPLHFGIVIILTLTLGMVTPPVGTNLFISCAVAGLPFNRIVKAIMPLLLIEVLWILIIAYLPEITLLLPRFFGLI